MGSNLNPSGESTIDKSVTRVPFDAAAAGFADLGEEGREVHLYVLAQPLYGAMGEEVDHVALSAYGLEETVVFAAHPDGSILPFVPEIGAFEGLAVDEVLIALGFEDVTSA